MDELTGDGVLLRTADNGNGNGAATATTTAMALAPGERPPYDAEAT